MEQREDKKNFVVEPKINFSELEKLINLLDPEEEVFSKTKMLMGEMKLEKSEDTNKDSAYILRR